MTDWDPPSDADLAPGKPGKPSLARRIRDLPIALAERASGSPWLNAAAEGVAIRDFGRAHNGETILAGAWTVPAGVYWVNVLACGGGGAGGEGKAIGGGGGSGGVCMRTIPVTPGQEIPITVGAGGDTRSVHSSVDTTLDNFIAGNGARTSVGVSPYHVIALGGIRGATGGLNANGGNGASGSSYSVVVDGATVVVPRESGARGSDGYIHLTDGEKRRSGRGADSYFGGAGDTKFDPNPNSGLVSWAVRLSGSAPGAGGGGGHGTLTAAVQGGNGANGIVIIRY